MQSTGDWWRRLAAAVKNKRSLYLSRMRSGHHLHHHRSGGRRIVVSQEVESAVIRATSHDERSVDYKSAGRVFAWARAAPAAFLDPLMWSLARRAARTRSWVVALKSLLLAHGLLLCSDEAPSPDRLGRLPFDLSEFSDRSSSAWGFSAFVRAYFRFLDRRSYFTALGPLKAPATTPTGREVGNDAAAPNSDDDLEQIERLQVLLDLLMQIRPYSDGMEKKLVLEAMDCVAMEIFEVYSAICNGIAQFLVSVLGPSATSKPNITGRPIAGREGEEAGLRRRGAIGMRILRRSSMQSTQLSAYFELCRDLGVRNSTEFPPVDRIPDKDINDLEYLLLTGGISGVQEEEEAAPAREKVAGVEREKEVKEAAKEMELEKHPTTVITKEWVVFEEEGHSRKIIEGQSGNNPFLWSPEKQPWQTPPVTAASSWAVMVNSGWKPMSNGNLIDLI